MENPKYSLHLFAGIGGGMLADIIGGDTVSVCAVEIEKYPADIFALRFPGLAIWDDIRTFRADWKPERGDTPPLQHYDLQLFRAIEGTAAPTVENNPPNPAP